MTIDELLVKMKKRSVTYSDTKKIRRAIAERLKELVEKRFKNAIVDNQVVSTGITVDISDNGDITTVIATGEELLFVEFGAGIYFNGSAGSSPHPKGEELGFTIGSYGKGKGAKTAWAFLRDGEVVWTHGTKAVMPVFRACEEVRREIPDIVRKVLSND